ncbi:MAG: hypothetical protein VX307_05960 [Chloroflexota bacterium]|nr:hypothetical protein [Chloroflexota bacterium]
MLLRDGDGDWAKATSLIDDSLAISNELGMRSPGGPGAVPAGDTEGVTITGDS